MKNKKKFFIIGLAVIACIVAGGALFVFAKKTPQNGFNEKMEEIGGKDWEQTGKFDVEEDEGITFELSLIDKCDDGEWINITAESEGQLTKEMSGAITTVDIEEEIYVLEGSERKLIFPKVEFGEFLEDRDVTLIVSEKGEDLVVRKAKCIKINDNGEIEEKLVPEEVKETEQLAMIKLAKEINSLAKKKGNWEVVSFLWPNKEYVYAEFSAIASDYDDEDMDDDDEIIDDDEVESFLLLLKIEKKGQEIMTKEIGLLKMDDDDEWVAVRGKDLFDEVDDGRLFDFDVDLGRWVKTY